MPGTAPAHGQPGTAVHGRPRTRCPGPGALRVATLLVAVLVLSLMAPGRAWAPPRDPARLPVIALDPGHGGIDGGTHWQGRVLEKDLTLQLARLMDPLLKSSGFRVVLTRTADYDLAPGDDDASVRRDLEERLRIAREAGAAALISLHVNAARDPRLRGPIVFYQAGDEPGRRLAMAVQAAMNAVFPPAARNEALPADFYLLARAGRPAVLIEFAFLTNPADRQLLLNPEGRSRMASAAVAGLVRGLGQLRRTKAGGNPDPPRPPGGAPHRPGRAPSPGHGAALASPASHPFPVWDRSPAVKLPGEG